MLVVGLPLITEFVQGHADSEGRMRAWLDDADAADWKTPADLKNRYPSASFLSGNRVVFNIGGNNYRLLAQIDYSAGIVLIKQVGTHAEYDRWKLE